MSVINDAHDKQDFRFLESHFSSLPPSFYTRLRPTPLPSPYLICTNETLANQFGIDHDTSSAGAGFTEIFTGNLCVTGSEPLASVYSGHQFGIWAGQLGDGRAILLGDLLHQNQQRYEVQLKGAGMTPYSRNGDGRAVLRSSIREFLCSEAMNALGIPSSRALCITGSDQRVMRESPETTAVVTRIASSFIRFGNFEHWYYNRQHEHLKLLADFVIKHYYPDCRNAKQPYKALLSEITRKTAELMAHWQSVGFMHGVMNTDNMSILGITLDYGPFGFMEAYNDAHICNHTDQQGRYSYRMQPEIGRWNTYALGQAMLPLIDSVEETEDALNIYQDSFSTHWEMLIRKKLGLFQTNVQDQTLIDNLFKLLQENHADFTLTFRNLSHLENQSSEKDHDFLNLFINRLSAENWLRQYRERLCLENCSQELRQQTMFSVNPKYILRNYLAQIAIEKAQNKDFSEVSKLLNILQTPYDEQPEYNSYARLPPDWASGLEVSCSS